MHMMKDTSGGGKIERPVLEWQLDDGGLLICFEPLIGGQHAGRRVTTRGLREIAAGYLEQFAPAATYVQPSLCLRRDPCTLEEPLDQVPLSAVKMQRIAREAVSQRVIEQLVVG